VDAVTEEGWPQPSTPEEVGGRVWLLVPVISICSTIALQVLALADF
jgi:hypothetical protein